MEKSTELVKDGIAFSFVLARRFTMGAPQVGPALVFFDAIVVSSHDLA
jgi:hypothetical protein